MSVFLLSKSPEHVGLYRLGCAASCLWFEYQAVVRYK